MHKGIQKPSAYKWHELCTSLFDYCMQSKVTTTIISINTIVALFPYGCVFCTTVVLTLLHNVVQQCVAEIEQSSISTILVAQIVVLVVHLLHNRYNFPRTTKF